MSAASAERDRIGADEVSAIVRSFVEERRDSGYAFDESCPLQDMGIDSFSLIELVLLLERTYGFALPLGLLTHENVSSTASFARCFVAEHERWRSAQLA